LIWKVLFDSECPVCCKFSKKIQSMDKNSNFILESYQYYSSQNDLPHKEELSKEIHIINNLGDIKRGPEAVTTILSILPGLRPYRWMIESRWGKRGTKILYKGLERYRKCRTCR
jgi:predicted DCC family thiol-disulfide oxidoreductase YuxK